MFGMSGGMSGAIHKPTRVIPQRGRDCCPFLRSKSRKFDVVRPKYRFTKPRHSSFVMRHASCAMRRSQLATDTIGHWTHASKIPGEVWGGQSPLQLPPSCSPLQTGARDEKKGNRMKRMKGMNRMRGVAIHVAWPTPLIRPAGRFRGHPRLDTLAAAMRSRTFSCFAIGIVEE